MVCSGIVGDNTWTPTSVTENMFSCTDGLDNDGDSLIDCQDSDCNGAISGQITCAPNCHPTTIKANQGFTTVQSTTSIANGGTISYSNPGTYSMNLPCGTYDLVASAGQYLAQTKIVVVAPNAAATQNFEMIVGLGCEADCTYASDDIVHAECRNINGCTFYDDISQNVCDLSQPGWVRDYNETHYVECAPGAPQPKTEIIPSVTCESGTLVKITRIVVYNGKPAKFVVATCSGDNGGHQ